MESLVLDLKRRIVSTAERVRFEETNTVRVQVHDPVHFCVWSIFHVLVNAFSGLRVRPDIGLSRAEYRDGVDIRT